MIYALFFMQLRTLLDRLLPALVHILDTSNPAVWSKVTTGWELYWRQVTPFLSLGIRLWLQLLNSLLGVSGWNNYISFRRGWQQCSSLWEAFCTKTFAVVSSPDWSNLCSNKTSVIWSIAKNCIVSAVLIITLMKYNENTLQKNHNSFKKTRFYDKS